MKRITQDISSGEFKKIYLLYGEEVYLRKQYKDMLKNAIVGDDDMNYSYYEGSQINIPSLIDQAETLPFFAPKRLIVIENSGLLKSGGEELADYLSTAPDSTYFVIVEENVDKRSKLFKTCDRIGLSVEMKTPDEMMLKRWVNKLFADSQKKISEKDIEYILERAGTDMVNLKSEVEKLICYVGDKQIVTKDDAEHIVTRRISNHIFDMVEAIGNQDQKKALNLYYELIALKEPPFRILSLIARQFNLLLQTKELMQKGTSRQTIAEKIKVPSFAVAKYVSEASKFSKDTLKRALEECVKADEAIKTGNISDKLSVELLIVEFARKE